MINVEIFRYHPEHDSKPYMQSLTLPDEFRKKWYWMRLSIYASKTQHWLIDAPAAKAYAAQMA